MPTDTFSITASGNDKQVGTGTQASYPPATSALEHNTTSATITVARSKYGGGAFEVIVGCLKWDTSSLPDDVTITAAVLRCVVTDKFNPDSLSLTAGWYLFDGTSADFSHNPETNAHAGTTIASLNTGVSTDFTLANLTNISKTGNTGLRLHLSQRASDNEPTGDNEVLIASYDDLSIAEPKLVVTYSVGGGDLVGQVGI